MEISWDEINTIIQERSSKNSSLIKPEEMDAFDAAKIDFLLTEINRFPDNQPTVAASGMLLYKHLSEKYPNLSRESISRLTNRFCWMNK
ncbi:MAG: hypothetical protein ACM3PP_10790 [Candidatus Saccharibacteria bacterium]